MERWWDASYRRTSNGWLYQIDSTRVPGAKDVRLKDLWKPEKVGAGWVTFPYEIVAAWPDFGWVKGFIGEPGPVCRGIPVPVEEWEDHAGILVGISAPELCVAAMLNVNGLASMLGVQPNTVTSYVARGTLPQPTFRREHQPLWSLPIIVKWRAVEQTQRPRTNLQQDASLVTGLTLPRTADGKLDLGLLDQAIELDWSDEPDEQFETENQPETYSDRYSTDR